MTVKLMVTVLGIGLIVWVNWYFLFSRKYGRSGKKNGKNG